MDYPYSQPSWHLLQRMRKRGERPMGGVWMVDDDSRRLLLLSRGLYAIRVPARAQAWLSGLDVFLLARRMPSRIELAQEIASTYPRFFALEWEGEQWQTVIDPNARH